MNMDVQHTPYATISSGDDKPGDSEPVTVVGLAVYETSVTETSVTDLTVSDLAAASSDTKAADDDADSSTDDEDDYASPTPSCLSRFRYTVMNCVPPDCATRCATVTGGLSVGVVACMGAAVGSVGCVGVGHLIAGTVHGGVSLAAVACWMHHPTTAADVLMVGVSTLGMLLLCFLSADKLYTGGAATRRQAGLLMALCYVLMFGQWARALWPSDPETRQRQQAVGLNVTAITMVDYTTCDPRCCTGTELLYGFGTVLAASILFLGRRCLDHIYPARGRAAGLRVTVSCRIGLTVTIALLLVTGLTVQAVAVYLEAAALLCVIPYAAPAPLWVMARASTGEGVMRGWERFLTAWICVVAPVWPLILHSGGVISDTVLTLTIIGVTALVAAWRALVVIVESKTGGSSSSGFSM